MLTEGSVNARLVDRLHNLATEKARAKLERVYPDTSKKS